MSGEPFPKSQQLARGERRYRRKVASAKQWQRMIAAKQGPCRVCEFAVGPYIRPSALPSGGDIQYHHLVSRADGGDDIEDNIVPLCSLCHHDVTVLHKPALQALAANLDDAEYAYVVGKLGESGMERLFGVGGSER